MPFHPSEANSCCSRCSRQISENPSIVTVASIDRLARGIPAHNSLSSLKAIVGNRNKSSNATGPPPWRRPDLTAVAPYLLRRRCLGSLGVLTAEPLHAPCRVNQALLAGEERVAVRADFHVDVALVGRPGLKVVSAGAHHAHRSIVGMNLFLGHR